MKTRIPALLFAYFTVCTYAQPQTSLVRQADSLEERGRFKEAATLLRSAIALSDSQRPSETRTSLEFELDRLRRIRIDYPLTTENLFGQLQASIKGLTKDEYDSWIKEGRFDCCSIDDTLRFLGVSRSNLFWRYPELHERRLRHSEDTVFESAVWNAVSSISEASISTGIPLALPKRFRIKMTVTVEPNTVPPGDTIRAWLPIPRVFPHQKEITLTASSSRVKHLADEDSPIRSAYLEQAATKDQPTVFWIEYNYMTYGVRFQLDPREVEPLNPEDLEVRLYMGKGPHIVFTDTIRNLSTTLVGRETNQLVKARKFYEWISEHIKYSYAREYSTIRNISDYCITKGYGDCGQEALLFMTLCRYNGIPARWQSGWFTIPGGKTIHDWAEIYIRPYGWIPVDPYMGIYAMRYFEGASMERRKQVRDFYFGGLDQYRMAANSNHCQDLQPPKRSLRSDNVDFQRGELECGTRNIYFDAYSYDLEMMEIDAAR